MQNVRAFFVVISAIALLAVAALLTASLTVAAFGAIAILSIAKAVSERFKPVPVRAKARRDARQPEMRIWNDGRGTIIDL